MPQTSDVWSLDEMMLNVKDTKLHGKGFYDWLWTIIDPHTRFVIATEVSKRRETIDAKRIIQKGKKATLVKPSYVITDSLHSYGKAIRQELDARVTAHIKTKSLSDGFQNRPIERYHNEIREKLKARRDWVMMNLLRNLQRHIVSIITLSDPIQDYQITSLLHKHQELTLTWERTKSRN